VNKTEEARILLSNSHGLRGLTVIGWEEPMRATDDFVGIPITTKYTPKAATDASYLDEK